MRMHEKVTAVSFIAGAVALASMAQPRDLAAQDTPPKLCIEGNDNTRLRCLAREVEKLQAALKGAVTKEELQQALSDRPTKNEVSEAIKKGLPPEKFLLVADTTGNCLTNQGGGGHTIIQACDNGQPQQKWSFLGAKQ